MSLMYVLLPLAMLAILLALGALFWLSRVKRAPLDKTIDTTSERPSVAEIEPHVTEKPSTNK